LEGSYTVLSYFTLYTIMCTHTELLNDTDNTIVILCYGLMFKMFKKALLGRRQAHYVPNITRFKLLLWSDENTICGKSCNAVSLGVPSTWNVNSTHIIIIHSAESPMWYLINSVVSCPEVIQLVLQICLIISSTFLCEQLFSLMIRKKVLRNIRLNRYK